MIGIQKKAVAFHVAAKGLAFVLVTTLTVAFGNTSLALPQCDKKKIPRPIDDKGSQERRRPIHDAAKGLAFVRIRTMTCPKGHVIGSPISCTKKKDPDQMNDRDPRKKAAAYSPTWCGSTIGADGLNFPVRNGKGWAPSPWPPKL